MGSASPTKLAPHTVTRKPVLPVMAWRTNCTGWKAINTTRGSASTGRRKKRRRSATSGEQLRILRIILSHARNFDQFILTGARRQATPMLGSRFG